MIGKSEMKTYTIDIYLLYSLTKIIFIKFDFITIDISNIKIQFDD